MQRITFVQTAEPAEYNSGEAEFLSMFDLRSLDDLVENSIVCQLKQVLLKWKNVFAMHNYKLGKTDLVKHTINLTDEMPIKQLHRRIPPGMMKEDNT